MKTAIGLDLYNQVATGQKTMTLCASRSDHEHIPCVLVSAPSIQRRAEASASSGTEVLPSEQVQSRQFYMTRRTGGDVRMGIKQQEPHPNGFRLQGPTIHPYYVLATQQGGAELMKDKCPTVTASAGMSGNNQPVVFIPERESGCLRHRPSGVQLRSECPVRLSHHGRGEHSAESKRTKCSGSSKEKK